MCYMNSNAMIKHSQQSGAALFMALIILLVLTILGVFGMNMSRLENLMAGNDQFMVTALSNAEYTLARGQEDIQEIAKVGSSFPKASDDWYYEADESIDPNVPNWSFKSNEVQIDTDGDGTIDETGNYIIVNAGTDNDDGEDSSFSGTTNPLPGAVVQVFLVTAQSDASKGAKRTVQSAIVTKPLAP